MMLYRLQCGQDHDFESWFRDSAAFDSQKVRGLVTCPVCGSTEVEKAIMAPALGAGTRKFAPEEPAAPAGVPAPAAAPVALMGEKEQALRAMLKAVREHVVNTADYVGEEFATKARRMHEGDEEKRAIYGEASPDEVRGLIEDDIEVMPLPNLPDERN
ncbi:DUF1178 family protein [Ancylobacter sp. A5.8]|uniref:DUF1178 family protein n=1 Tax=Ancylobacter gelatini TaxID=2919920 RepID=UPI001F4E6C5E|nr:DUF1178 family protein [Ancylobacter gelatini]MCJ8144898.1 DUF1178 family protein [Ancylobacter gelatini]